LVEYTNAKTPKEFCGGYKLNKSKIPVQIIEQFVFDPNQQYYQPPAKRTKKVLLNLNQPKIQLPAHENEYNTLDTSLQYLQTLTQQNNSPAFDLNLKPSVSTPSVYSGEYLFIDCNQARASISYEDYDKSPGFDLNKSPPKD